MSEPTFRPVTAADRDDLARFLREHRWPFHVKPELGPSEAAGLVAGWDLDGPSTRAWRLERDGRVAGLLKVDDLGSAWDPSWGPAHRRGPPGRRPWHGGRALAGRGGVRRLARGAAHRGPDPARQPGHAGGAAPLRYVMEAVYRRAWPDPDGRYHDGIGYALLHEDWERGTTTPVDWDEG
jgi:hypothetical protein